MDRCTFCHFPLAPHKKKYCTPICEELDRLLNEKEVPVYNFQDYKKPEKPPSE
ncbi:MAG: hypothetical protein JWL88_450 [Parcubacteria group bacterium]|nr:hypothetical protein [Parcubacteria group bacterium]